MLPIRIRVDPKYLGMNSYVLRAESPIDGGLKYSASFSTPGRITFTVGNKPVHVRLTDWQTSNPLPNQEISVLELNSNGSRSWVTKRITDAEGRVKIDLDGVDMGRRYVLRSKPYLQWIEKIVDTSGWHGISAGKVVFNVTDGADSQALRNSPVVLLKIQTDGSSRGLIQVNTDNQGQVKLDPPDLGLDTYMLRATSSVDGSLKFSRVFKWAGQYDFAVGNPPVTLVLQDWATGTALPRKNVTFWKVGVNGARAWHAKRETDETGRITIDLDGITEGQRYVADLQPYDQRIEREITAPGLLTIKAGQLTVRVTHGGNGALLRYKEVYLFKRDTAGNLEDGRKFVTDGQGLLLLDPMGLGQDTYVLRAASPIDGTYKFSDRITSAGSTEFSVGNPAVVVRVTDWESKNPAPNLDVTFFEILPNQELKYIIRRQTDSDGRITIDLDDIDEGRRYLARTKLYLQKIDRLIDRSGWHGIVAGRVVVTVRSGASMMPFTNTDVALLEDTGQGFSWVQWARTDGTGLLRLDPKELGTKRYVLRAEAENRTPAERHAAMTWAQRLKRVFNIDIETCQACGGAVKIIACIEDPHVIRKILDHLNRLAPTTDPNSLPEPRAPPQPGLFDMR